MSDALEVIVTPQPDFVAEISPGVPGPIGLTGPQGEKGEKGDQGPAGDSSASVTSSAVTTALGYVPTSPSTLSSAIAALSSIYTTTAAVASQITTALAGYATQSWVTAQGYITSASLTWENITGKPSFFSGSYNDLTNKPTIPATQVNSDWNATSGVSQIQNKPSLFSGSYTDLSNKPTLGTAASHAATDFDSAGAAATAQTNAESYTDSSISALSSIYRTAAQVTSAITAYGYQTAAQVTSAITAYGYQTAAQVSSAITSALTWANISGKPSTFTPSAHASTHASAGSDPITLTKAQISDFPSLAIVATSGSYNDLSSKPTIPAAQVQTDWNASSGLGVLLNKPTLFNAATPGAIGGTTAAAGTFTVLTCAQLVATVTSANTSAISSTGYSLTGTDATSLVTLAGTWNTSGTPTAIKLNITDTASNASSLLMDLQVGGSSKFNIKKSGDASMGVVTCWGVNTNNSAITCGDVNLNTTAKALIFGYQAYLYTDAAGTLAQRNGANAQTFRLYNTYTDASNYERGFMRWNSNVLEIGTEAAGTGTARVTRITSGSYAEINVPNAGYLNINVFGSTKLGIGGARNISNQLIQLNYSSAPASATASGAAGDIAWDTSYFYVCTATNTWKRAALSTW